MLVQTRQTRLSLRRGDAYRLTRAHGTRLHVQRGTAWVTVDGDPIDHVLERGESLVIGGDAGVIVTPLASDRLIVGIDDCGASAAPATGWRAWASRFGLSALRPEVRVAPSMRVCAGT